MPFSSYQRRRLGHAEIAPRGELEAGSYATLQLTYTAGDFGIDDTGAIKFSWRTASDAGKPQFSEPLAPGYSTARASNGATLAIEVNRNNLRPWVNTLFIRVARGFLRAGERISVTLGDRSGGSPGLRLQTACEEEFYFKTFVDAFSTYDFVELEQSPKIRLVPGPVARWKAILPTLRRVGEPFRLALVAEDRWGNPSDRAAGRLVLRPDHPVAGLPGAVDVAAGDGPVVIEGLSVAAPADLRIALQAADGAPLALSNPLRIVEDAALLAYWGDLHGQSNETVGTNSAADYFAFARDKAFLDIVGHQGNDFQIEDDFWSEINRLAKEYDKPGEMVALPGYEWSGNTGMGGDRNVFFATEGRPIRRSSSVLLEREAATDRFTAGELFRALEGEDAVVIAHVGGRYADLEVGHDGRLERAVEVHSCWGTFEWLLHDAFRLGHRVGLVCHSDDHKGRPGAAYPGASTFGAIGGLTSYLMPRLDRRTLFETLRRRHCYGTTGTRLHLDVKVRFMGGAELFEDDPKLGPAASAPASEAMMGDIVRSGDAEVTLEVEALGAAPLERVVLFNGTEPVATVRSYGEAELGARIRVLFEGAEYRGRDRDVHWQGHALLAGNRFTRARAINFFNVDRPLRAAEDGRRVDFQAVTTGNFAGFDLWLEDAAAGELSFVSNVIERTVKLAEIGLEDVVFEAGGLGRRLRLFRLPEVSEVWRMQASRRIALRPGVDNPLYVRVTQEDGHQAWSSPIYVIS
jgi:hypothetical protein